MDKAITPAKMPAPKATARTMICAGFIVDPSELNAKTPTWRLSQARSVDGKGQGKVNAALANVVTEI
jgi:hypothetical protein